MNDVAREYGGALFALAADEGLQKELLCEVETARALLIENPLYIKLLSSPEIGVSEREETVAAAFCDAHPYLRNFLRMMVARGYARELPDAFAEYGRLYREKNGIELAVIQSATELSDAEKEKLVSALSRRAGKEIFPEYRVEPNLIGGIRVALGGVLYDGTLRRRLDGLCKSLSEMTL